eukprot:3796244-Pyramimonas_sp.AAC.1
MQEAHDATAIKMLQLFKLAVGKVARNVVADQSAPTAAGSLEDRLWLSTKLRRSIEAGLPGKVSKCIGACPKLGELVHNPCDFEGNLSARLRGLRQRAVDLAREGAPGELGDPRPSNRALDENGDVDNGGRKGRARARGARSRFIGWPPVFPLA